jgi:hypothetical protein
MGIMTSSAVQSPGGQAEMSLRKLRRIPVVAARTGGTGGSKKEVSVGSDVRTVTFEAAVRLGSRRVHCLACELLLDLLMARAAERSHRRHEKRRHGAGVRLMAAGTAINGRRMPGPAGWRRGGDVVAVSAELSRRPREEPRMLGRVRIMAGVAVARFERWVLR